MHKMLEWNLVKKTRIQIKDTTRGYEANDRNMTNGSFCRRKMCRNAGAISRMEFLTEQKESSLHSGKILGRKQVVVLHLCRNHAKMI